MCSKEKQERFFFNHETYTRIIVIDLVNSELIWILFHDFFLQRKRVFYVNICILVCDCYFELIVFVIIFLGPNIHVVRSMKLN